MKKNPPHGVICYWEYKPSEKKGMSRIWHLVEAYPIDMDGYPLVQVKNTGKINSRQEWDNWMNTQEPDDEGYGDYVPIMGRAVTVWTVEGGVHLLDLHPPEWVPWLSITFIEELKKLSNWSQFLECGYDLYLGTARAAEKIIFNEKEPA